MEAFYIITLTIAVTILILILTYVGIKMRNTKKNAVFPPQNYICPDNWSYNGSGCVIPTTTDQSKMNITNTPGYDGLSINFSDPGWRSNGKTAICNQAAWAKHNNINWDGVSNYSGC
jgi:hypothetical protein